MLLTRALLTAICILAGPKARSAEQISIAIAKGAGAIGSAPLVVAVSGHHFAGAGINAALIEFADDAAVRQAVAEGRAEFGAARLDGAFLAYAAAHGLKIIAPEYSDKTGFPAMGLLVSKAAYEAGLRGPQSLAHRRIGMTSPDSAARFELIEAAQRYGIAPDAIELVWLGSEAKLLSAFESGTIDAVVVPFATAFELRRESKAAAVIRLSDYIEAQQGVVFGLADTIRTKRDEVETFMRAYRAAVTDYDLTFQQRDDGGSVLPGAHFSEYLNAMAKQAGIVPELLAFALPYCDHLARLDVDDLRRQLRFWQNEGLVPTGITVDSIMDLSFNPEHIGGWLPERKSE